MGGQDKVDQEVHPVGDRNGGMGGRWVKGWRCGDRDGQCPNGRSTVCGGGGT